MGKHIFDVIDRDPLIKNDGANLTNFDIKEGIYFKNVTFKYPTAKETLKKTFDNVSFSIKAGEITAIVGPSGSGKSTIV